MAHSFYRGTDHELYTGSADFSAKISASPGAYGLVPSQCAQYVSVSAGYAAAYEAVQDPATRTRGKTSAKNQARANLRSMTSDLAKMINGTPTVTDAQKIELALSVRATPSPIPRPRAHPAVDIVAVSGRLVSVRFRDSESPSRRGRPAGVLGANVYRFAGPTFPTDPRGWEFHAATTKRTFDVRFPDSVAPGTQVWICATWFNPKAETGPVSDPVMTFIQGGLSMAA